MPAVTDVFRFRFRTTPKIPLRPSEDDTDRSSSPEHLPLKSAVRGHKATASVSRPSDKKDVARHADPVCLPTAAPSSGKQPTSAAHDVKVTLVRRVTSKLHIAIPKSRSTPASDSRSPPQTDSRPSFHANAAKHALRERGLLPPKKDLSQQERDEDARLPVVPLCSSTEPNRAIDGRTKGMMSLAEKIKQDSLPPLSTSLEVLPEEQDREGPFTPPPSASPPNVYIQGQTVTGPGIVISTVVDAHNAEDADESPTQTMVESPNRTMSVSPSVSLSPPRKYTSDCLLNEVEEGKVSSFTNLRRSVSTSLRSISNYSHRSTTPSSDAASGMTGEATLRTPVSPTMHNRASIWFEMRAVEDPESRRLCEMAFLD
ncbi:hypothetical protein F5141DRAFT_1064363 [Pisolithus sp. B1]|nr:hypothetical protein F5141DRAFT_1064363 [Pisolithus sp. B1]